MIAIDPFQFKYDALYLITVSLTQFNELIS